MLDFVCIGAQKAATTWLYSHLNKHAQISFPLGKEGHYWDWVQSGKRPSRPDWYREQFPSVDSVMNGDMTPAYALLEDDIVAEFCEMFPHMRAFMILRNPIERAWSNVRMVCESSQLEPNEITACFLDTIVNANSVLEKGNYVTTLKRWEAHLGSDQLKTWFYEDIRDNPSRVLSELSRYLGINDEWGDIRRSKLLERRVRQGPTMPIPTEIKNRLREYYEPTTAQLEAFLGVNLEHWK